MSLFQSSDLIDGASSLLKWTFSGCSLLSAIELLQRPNLSPRRPVCVTLCDIAYVLCNTLTAVLVSGISSTQAAFENTRRPGEAAAIVAIAWLTLSAALQRWRGLSTSNLPVALHGCYFVATICDLITIKQGSLFNMESSLLKQEEQHAQRILVTFASLGSFVCAFFRSSPVVNKMDAPGDEETLSPFGKLLGVATFRYIINVGLLSKEAEDDVLPLVRRLKSKLLAKYMRSALRVECAGRGPQLHLASAILRVLWTEALWVLITGLAYFTTLVVRVPLLEALIDDIGGEEAKAVTLLFLVTCVAEVGFSGFLEYVALRFSQQVKALVQSALFTKTTRMSVSALSEAQAGYLVSLVGVDCDQLFNATIVFSQFAGGLLPLPVLVWMLAARLGALPAAGVVAWQLALLALFLPASRLQAAICGRIVRYRDQRLGKMTDTLSCVRLVKFYAWEAAVEEAVSRLREKEGFFLFLANLLDGFVDTLQMSSTSVMTIILFGTFAAVNQHVRLTAAGSFSSLYMLSIMDAVFCNMSSLIRFISMVSQGFRRIAKTLTAEEETTDRRRRPGMLVKQGGVLLDDCSFAWTDTRQKSSRTLAVEEPALNDVSVDFPPGGLTGVVGLVGSGKSALLEAILGQLRCLQGNVYLKGSIAYLPQTACIFNMTIRDNVLFGKRMEPMRYRRVLEACDLARDLQSLPAGDLTEVGEKGETLSGGQKQRLALARAVYSDSDIYLMDDTLSALDVHVAAKVFTRIIGNHGHLRHKTRIMVCNQGMFLRHVDKLLFVWEKRVLSYGTLEELHTDPRAPETLLLGSNPESSARKHTGNGYSPSDQDENAISGKLISDEVKDAGLRCTDLLQSFVSMSGICLLLALLCIVARAVVVALLLIWIKLWTDASTTEKDGGRSNATWVAVLAVLCLCDLLFSTLGGCLLAVSCRRLSSRLHKGMLRRLLFSPVSFFDSTPRGRVLNRFSADLDRVDSRLYLIAKEVLQTLTVSVARLAVVGTQAPLACGLGVAATAVYVAVVAVTVRAASDLSIQESGMISRVLQHLAETRDSMTSVRCYDAVTLICRRFYRLVDGAFKPLCALVACVRFTRVTGGVAGFCVILASVLTVSISSTPPSQGGLGLALSSSMSIPMLLSSVNAALFFAFVTAIALRRTVEYTRLPTEDDSHEKETARLKGKAPRNVLSTDSSLLLWPKEGIIAFEGFTASYRPDSLPAVLQDVSFVIRAHEKVGVVGRTGAGKSSLILALLRVLRPSRGRITIDGVDVASVPLRKLRTALTVIPQEPYLMKGSLRENLDPTGSHSDQQVWKALREAHLADFVSRQPQGLLLEIGDGAENLSAGQRQLVCLARALLRSPRVLLLDEATSRMDGDTDRLIQCTLKGCFASCTVLTIAHRLNTVLDCDRILVMSEGRVAEFGTVAELAANPDSAFRAMAQAAGIDLSAQRNGFRSSHA